jgi:peptide/nickel transport system substrate-binding protein
MTIAEDAPTEAPTWRTLPEPSSRPAPLDDGEPRSFAPFDSTPPETAIGAGEDAAERPAQRPRAPGVVAVPDPRGSGRRRSHRRGRGVVAARRSRALRFRHGARRSAGAGCGERRGRTGAARDGRHRERRVDGDREQRRADDRARDDRGRCSGFDGRIGRDAPPANAAASAAPAIEPDRTRAAAGTTAPEALEANASAWMRDRVPGLARAAERRLAPVLAAAARSPELRRRSEIRTAAQSARAVVAPPSGAAFDAREAQRLDDAAQAAVRRDHDLAVALHLQTQAFGANPLDPEVAGNLALLHLNEPSPQAEPARQLALHALTLKDDRFPTGRIEDWTTLAIAAALTGRERDARNAWFVSMALTGDLQRQCDAAVHARATYGERVRPSVQAMLQRARSSAAYGRCEIPQADACREARRQEASRARARRRRSARSRKVGAPSFAGEPAMPLHRSFLASATALLLAAILAFAPPASAQQRKDSVVLGMVLEPAPGLDPTTAAAAAIGEVVHMNVLEGLTKINMDGKVTPLLAESWSTDPDGKVYTFKLRKGVKFHDGEALDSSDVKFSFERAKAEGSTNKAKKAVFDNIARIDTPDPSTVIVVLNNADGNFLFRMGENTAVDPRPEERADDRDQADRHRAVQVRVVAEGLGDHAGQERAVPRRRQGADEEGDVSLHQRPGGAGRGAARRRHRRHAALRRARVAQAVPERSALLGDRRRHRGQDDHDDQQQEKAVRRRPRPPRARRGDRPQGDHRRRAGGLRHSDRQPHGAERRRLRRPHRRQPVQPGEGEGAAQGSRRADAAQRHADAAAAGVREKGGEIIASQLAKVGVVAKIENVEWAQWLSGAFKGNFDLTVISHVEPLDFDRYADPNYYYGYDSKAYKDLLNTYNTTTDAKARLKILGDISASSRPTRSMPTCSSCRSSRSRTSG